MKTIIKPFLMVVFVAAMFSCSSQKPKAFEPTVVYKSSTLIITRIDENAFEHTSFLQTNDYGNVPCNGLILRNNNEVVVFDTPTTDSTSAELINFISDSLHCKINAIIPTHFHDDCLGGLKAFHDKQIPSYAYYKTIELAKANHYYIPQHSFSDSLILMAGNQKITARFFGEGHTVDNVVGYMPGTQIMFGGCLIKELNASKGYLGDANVAEWSNTVERVKKQYPDVKIVIPGHGKYGDKQLLDYTINLFRVKQ